MKEYDEGIKHEKSALKHFSDKYVIKGKPDLIPLKYFKEKERILQKFLRNHKNKSIRMILTCRMKLRFSEKGYVFFNYRISEFSSQTYLNDGWINNKDLLILMIKEILDEILYSPLKETGWMFDEVIKLGIHTTNYLPLNGDSYIPLPDFLMRKKR